MEGSARRTRRMYRLHFPETHMAEADRSEGEYVSTPQGIFTASGVWFSATEEMLRDYAGPLFEHVPLAALLRRAVRWIRSAQVLTLWILPLLLFFLPPLAAALAALTFYAGWRVLSPSFATRIGAAVIGFLDKVVLQGLYYVFMLSLLAGQGRLVAVFVGLAGFVLLRWGLVERLVHPLLRRLWRTLYELPVPDQVLRAFIIRAALRHGASLPDLERMKRRILEVWNRKTK